MQVLGAGGFATVYLAEDPRLEAPVAIKLLSEGMAADVDLRSRFIEEARVMRRLAASGLVTVHDIDEHEGRPYFVMEHCARGTLADRLDALGRPLKLEESLGLASALTRSTAAIHKMSVVHRDLKPSNFLIRETPTETQITVGGLLAADEELVVGDFGLAKAVDLAATRLSLAGGTPGYSAPEQFLGDPTVDTRADVYALSAILVSEMTGEQPQPVLAPGQQAFAHDIIESTEPLSSELSRGLSIDREERHRDVIEWGRSLVGAKESVEDRPHDPASADTELAARPEPARGWSTDQQVPRRSGRRRLAVPVLMLGATGVLTAGGWIAFARDAPTELPQPSPTTSGATSITAAEEGSPSSALPTSTTSSTRRPTTTTSSPPTDEEIRASLQERVPAGVEVAVVDGDVSLTGTVSSLKDWLAANDAVFSTPGVRGSDVPSIRVVADDPARDLEAALNSVDGLGFDVGLPRLEPAAAMAFTRYIDLLAFYPDLTVEVVGFSSATDGSDAPASLALDRASEVVDHLRERGASNPFRVAGDDRADEVVFRVLG